jgi:nucleolar protein 12
VIRAKKFSKSSQSTKDSGSSGPTKDRVYNPKKSAEDQSLAGRAQKLFGHGGAQRLAQDDGSLNGKLTKSSGRMVFEGHRARNDPSASGFQGSRTGGGKGKAMNRSRRRAAAYKAAGGTKK